MDMKINKKRLKAFTLIELLVILAVLSTMFTIFISKVDFATYKAKDAGILTDFRSYNLAFDTLVREGNLESILDVEEKFVTELNSLLDNKLQFNTNKPYLSNTINTYGYKYELRFEAGEISVYSIGDGIRNSNWLFAQAAEDITEQNYSGLKGKINTIDTNSDSYMQFKIGVFESKLLTKQEKHIDNGNSDGTGDNSSSEPVIPEDPKEDPVSVIGIEVVNLPNKLTYLKGETLKTDGLLVEAIYSDETRSTISDYTITVNTPLALGENIVTITHKEVECTFKVTASNPFKATYNYTGNYVPVTLSAGKYTLEAWGAQGGQAKTTVGANGGYAKGVVTLKTDTTFYIYVGEAGKNAPSNGTRGNGGWNGGGGGTYAGLSDGSGAGGGGASDIRLISGACDNSTSLLSRILVAGGGGGAGTYGTKTGIGYGGGGTTGSGSGIGGDQQSTNGAYFGRGWDGGGGKSGFPGGGAGGGWYGGQTKVFTGNLYSNSGGGSGYVLTSSSYKPSGYSGTSLYYMTETVLTNTVNAGNGKVIITQIG